MLLHFSTSLLPDRSGSEQNRSLRFFLRSADKPVDDANRSTTNGRM
jgi:hypothetical protein